MLCIVTPFSNDSVFANQFSSTSKTTTLMNKFVFTIKNILFKRLINRIIIKTL